MRMIFPIAALLGGCSAAPAVPDVSPGSYAGKGRDRMCIAALDADTLRGGVITYGAGDQNCQVAGRVEEAAGQLTLIPTGEGDCRIPLIEDGGSLRIGAVPQACSYYCAPGVSLGGKRFDLVKGVGAATDFAGDPLC